MYYTFRKQRENTQVSPYTMEELLTNPNLIWVERTDFPTTEEAKHNKTVIIANEKLARIKIKHRVVLQTIFSVLHTINTCDPAIEYDHFQIPKKSGGLRQIDAPKEPLMYHLKTLKNSLETNLSPLPHEAAYAYVKQRSAKEALEAHQKNESKWFLKLDIKDFFPSCTEEHVKWKNFF